MVSGSGIIQVTQCVMHSWIRLEMFVNQVIKLYEHLQDISEVIWVLKSWVKLSFGSAVWWHRHWTAENIVTNRTNTVQAEEQLTNVYIWHDLWIKHHRFFLPLGKGGSVFLQQELWNFSPGHLQSKGIGNVMLNCWRMHMSMIMWWYVMTLNLNLSLSNYTITLFVP